ncbi:MAG: hemolysin III family protein [Woeseiaceae bacterium]
MSQQRLKQYTVVEEMIHAATHGVGVILSIVGLTWMLYVSISASDAWRIVAVFKLLDHCAIYLLIAGTYTPFLLVAMRSSTGWWLFGTIWALATAGVVTKLWFRHRFPKIALASYLAMGWLIVVAAPQVAAAIGPNGMAWLVAGGISYSAGVVFYVLERMPFNHAIWHVFVLIGGICHFFGIALHVLPTTS